MCRQAHAKTEENDSLFETEWISLGQPSQSMEQEPSLLLSHAKLDIYLPSYWISAGVYEKTEISEFKTIAFFISGFESDIEFGLSLLQKAGNSLKQVIFITTPSCEIGAALWGLARTFRLERPDIRVRCIECTIDKISEVLITAGEDEISLRQDGEFYVPAPPSPSEHKFRTARM